LKSLAVERFCIIRLHLVQPPSPEEKRKIKRIIELHLSTASFVPPPEKDKQEEDTPS